MHASPFPGCRLAGMIAAGEAVPEADGAAPGRRWAPKRGGRLWRDADFLKRWAGQSISRLGTFVTALALPTAAIELLGAGPVEVGALAALQALPFAVLGIRTHLGGHRRGQDGPPMVLLRIGQSCHLHHQTLAHLRLWWVRCGWTSPPRSVRWPLQAG